MRSITIETRIVVPPARQITLQLPPEIRLGTHRAIVVIDEQPETPVESEETGFPVLHVKQWPEHLSLRRENMYGDFGR